MTNKFVPDSELYLVSDFHSMLKEYEDGTELFNHVQHRLTLLKALHRSYLSAFIDHAFHQGHAESIMEEIERILFEVIPYIDRIRQVEKLNEGIEVEHPIFRHYFEGVSAELFKYFSIVVEEKNGGFKQKCELQKRGRIDYTDSDFDKIIDEFKSQDCVTNCFEKQILGEHI